MTDEELMEADPAFKKRMEQLKEKMNEIYGPMQSDEDDYNQQ